MSGITVFRGSLLLAISNGFLLKDSLLVDSIDLCL